MSNSTGMQTTFHHGTGLAQGPGLAQNTMNMTQTSAGMGSVQGHWEHAHLSSQQHHHPHSSSNGMVQEGGLSRDAHTHINPSAVLARPQVPTITLLITLSNPNKVYPFLTSPYPSSCSIWWIVMQKSNE